MKGSKTLKRRKFIQAAAAAAASGSFVSCGGPKPPWRFFTAGEAAVVNALCETIIPADQDPGAGWAGVVRYIDRQLHRWFRENREPYRLGVAAIEKTAQKMHGRSFVELTPDERTAMVASIEKGQAPAGLWQGVSQKEFFDLILNHTMQGFYGDPRHGGNREMVSWKMLGVPVTAIRGRQHYEFPPRS